MTIRESPGMSCCLIYILFLILHKGFVRLQVLSIHQCSHLTWDIEIIMSQTHDFFPKIQPFLVPPHDFDLHPSQSHSIHHPQAYCLPSQASFIPSANLGCHALQLYGLSQSSNVYGSSQMPPMHIMPTLPP